LGSREEKFRPKNFFGGTLQPRLGEPNSPKSESEAVAQIAPAGNDAGDNGAFGVGSY